MSLLPALEAFAEAEAHVAEGPPLRLPAGSTFALWIPRKVFSTSADRAPDTLMVRFIYGSNKWALPMSSHVMSLSMSTRISMRSAKVAMPMR